jgi:hypothetical protein
MLSLCCCHGRVNSPSKKSYAANPAAKWKIRAAGRACVNVIDPAEQPRREWTAEGYAGAKLIKFIAPSPALVIAQRGRAVLLPARIKIFAVF